MLEGSLFEKKKSKVTKYINTPEVKLEIPEKLLRRSSLSIFPNLSELEVVRHFTNLSCLNYGIDNNIYPLGSCSMKYNPKVNEALAELEEFIDIHPYMDEEYVQGALRIIYELERFLCEITGMDGFTLQPSAGAHGELTGLLMTKAYFEDKREERDLVIVPDSAHGTNPASAVMAGFKVVEIKSDRRGLVSPSAIKQFLNGKTALVMLTNPNTLGLFEEDIAEIAHLVHSVGGLLYYDGANLNGIVGVTRPGDMGFDIVHLNLHKTFSAPHGGGGPGSGPVGVKDYLVPFLPIPRVTYKDGSYFWDYNFPKSIGKVKCFYGNFAVLIKAYCYIRLLGKRGLKSIAEISTLNANYLQKRIEEFLEIPYKRLCKHEFVASLKSFRAKGIRALDIAKRLIDKGFHPPTVYFPLIVEEAFMIEPTETESLDSLDRFVKALKEVVEEADTNPDIVREAPKEHIIKRIDEAKASRTLKVKWQ
ncbi:MAG: aminomethyl-transferring glycine dehydrogenase subunit GcvPB [bacterium]|nr:aminomethyl-transferring glycine dehydrogenase subunit GcvPB [bacterium]